MKITKKQIEEAILGTGMQQQPETENMPSTQEVKDITSAIKDATEAIKAAGQAANENPMPFMTKVGENYDPNYGGAERIEFEAWKNDEIRNAFHEWLVGTPEGQAYAREFENQPKPEENPTDDLPFEGFKDKRKVIKTIKLKDLK